MEDEVALVVTDRRGIAVALFVRIHQAISAIAIAIPIAVAVAVPIAVALAFTPTPPRSVGVARLHAFAVGATVGQLRLARIAHAVTISVAIAGRGRIGHGIRVVIPAIAAG